ncbi:MAG: hypothetical protein ACE5L6_00230 [Candidatus Bathyarchaeia archaeon]
MREIDEVVSLIKDDQWHTLEDIIKKTKLPQSQTNKILEFLTNYNFIDYDPKHEKVKVTPSLMKFLNEDQTC